MIILAETDRLLTALTKFSRQVQRAGILADLRDHRAYLKPSERRRLKRKRAANRRAKEAKRAAAKRR